MESHSPSTTFRASLESSKGKEFSVHRRHTENITQKCRRGSSQVPSLEDCVNSFLLKKQTPMHTDLHPLNWETCMYQHVCHFIKYCLVLTYTPSSTVMLCFLFYYPASFWWPSTLYLSHWLLESLPVSTE